MHRLLLLVATFALAWFATGYLAQSPEPATFVFRDGLFVATLAAIAFALNSSFVPTRLQAPASLQELLLPALTFLLAIALRLWQLTELPADCIGEECSRALQLTEGVNGGIVHRLAALFWPQTQDGLFCLRLASALVGSLSVMAFYGLASQIASPGGALIGTLLLAITPWHLWLSRSGDPTVGLILTATLFLWALLALVQRAERWRWIATGLALLLLLSEFLGMPTAQRADSLLHSLFNASANDLSSPFSAAPLLPTLLSALALCGLAVAVRWSKERRFAGIVGITAIGCLLIWLAVAPATLLLPILFVLATVALDQLLRTLLLTWQPLIQPQTIFAGALLVALLAGGSSTVALLTRLNTLRTTEANAVNGAIARYLLATHRAEPQTIFFIPPALRFDPGARLLLGDTLSSDQVRAIDPAKLPFSNVTPSDVVFLLPPEQVDLLSLLRQIYPLARLEPQVNDEGNVNFNTLRLNSDALAAQQPLPFVGLAATYFAGDQLQGMTLAQQVDPLPGYPADLSEPYSVLWSGKIAAVRSGEYLLGILAEGTLGMIIDGTQIITSVRDESSIDKDAMNALHEGALFLERGWHSIEIRYTPNVPFAPLKLYWQPPGSGPVPLRSEFLNPDSDPTNQPPLYGSMLPLADQRLGMEDGFALTSSVDLWQRSPQSGIFNVSPLVAESVWQSAAGCGAGEGQLSRPHGAIFDPIRGQILVADTDNRRIVGYSLAGQLIQSYTDTGFQEPVDVAVDASGNILVLDAMVNGIFRIDPAGNRVSPFPIDTSFYRPRGFSADPLGMIVVADTGGARVVVLNDAGQTMGEFGGINSTLGKGQPSDVLAFNNVWWTIAAEDGRIWSLATLGSLGALSYNNTIDGPQMTALPNGSFFVSDPSQQRILYFAATGEPLRQLTGQHAVPTGIAATVIEGQTYLAVVDSAACSLTLWRVVEL